MPENSLLIPKVTSSEIAHKGFFTLKIDKLKLPHGIQRPYTVLETGHHAAAILAVTEDKKLVLLKEYRHPTGKWILGCPGGRIDVGESPVEAAKRELLEETGYIAQEYVYIGKAYPFAAVCGQIIHYVLATGATYSKEPTHEDFELIQPFLMQENDLERTLLQGGSIDGVLCTAFFFKNLYAHQKA